MERLQERHPLHGSKLACIPLCFPGLMIDSDVEGVQWDLKMQGMTNMKEGGYAYHIRKPSLSNFEPALLILILAFRSITF